MPKAKVETDQRITNRAGIRAAQRSRGSDTGPRTWLTCDEPGCEEFRDLDVYDYAQSVSDGWIEIPVPGRVLGRDFAAFLTICPNHAREYAVDPSKAAHLVNLTLR